MSLNAEGLSRRESQVLDFGGERGTRTLDFGTECHAQTRLSYLTAKSRIGRRRRSRQAKIARHSHRINSLPFHVPRLIVRKLLRGSLPHSGQSPDLRVKKTRGTDRTTPFSPATLAQRVQRDGAPLITPYWLNDFQ
jgi:hypothetical protein